MFYLFVRVCPCLQIIALVRVQETSYYCPLVVNNYQSHGKIKKGRIKRVSVGTMQ